MKSRTARIGIDLGGTKIEGIALGTDGGVLARRRVPTPKADYDATISAVRDLVVTLEIELGVSATVGVGMPGAISPTSGLIKNANSTCLIGHPLDRDLAVALDRDVRVANDANCFALSEAVDGAAQAAPIVFGVILGTGVGGGVVIDKQVLSGANAITGEWGHNLLPGAHGAELPGPQCYCGRRGCIETWLSGPGLAADFRRSTGLELRPPQVVDEVCHGNRHAEDCLRRYENRLARALAQVVNILDPHVIVLGGGLSNIPRLYSAVAAIWSDYIFSDTIATRIVAPRFGDSSGVRGAAWLWPSN